MVVSITEGTGSSRSKYETVSAVGVASTPASSGAQAPAVVDGDARAQTAAATPSPSSSIGATRRRSRTSTPAASAASAVRADDPPVRLEEAVVAGIDPDPEPVLDLTGVEHGERRPAGGERVAVRPPVAEVDAVQGEQRTAAVGLELAPEREALLRESHPARVRVGEAHDPGGTVAGAARMAELELLADDDVAPRPLQLPGRGEPHHTCAHDDHLVSTALTRGSVTAQRATVRSANRCGGRTRASATANVCSTVPVPAARLIASTSSKEEKKRSSSSASNWVPRPSCISERASSGWKACL